MAHFVSSVKLTESSKHLHKKRRFNKKIIKPAISVVITKILTGFERIDGVEKVSLSPNTQVFIGCKNGEDITPEKPWTFVEKRKIEDDLDTYKEASEFKNFERRIRRYPEKEMLLGTLSGQLNEKIEYYLCTSVSAKNEILLHLQKEHDDILAKIQACIRPEPRPWISLGSEVEVDGGINLNNRCLLVVELQSLYPFVRQKVKFGVRTAAKERRNTYMEILPSGRTALNYIMRRCVDQSTQSTGDRANKKLQALIVAMANKSTQYQYKIPKKILSTRNKEIFTFIGNIYKTISSQLLVNTTINNFLDDYHDLIKRPIRTRMLRPTEISTHQDIANCKDKKISSISWNSLISGVIAAAYVEQPNFSITTQDLTMQQLPRNFYSEDRYLVLIWTHENNLLPKLYLHAIREVTTLSFCPYNANILVGGCSNGQILVWDLSNKLNMDERRNSCTKPAYQVTIMIESLTDWIKKIPGDDHVFPIIISDLDSGHLTAISSIVWLPTAHYISRYGMYEDSIEDQKHMQFMSSSLGGSKIFVYDLISNKKQNTQKKISRLAQMPSGLKVTKSVLTKMRYNFYPKYQMNIADPSNLHAYNPIMKLIFRNDIYNYECQNPETIDDYTKTSYFKVLDLKHPFDRTMNVMCSTGGGTLQIASWDGHHYDQGQAVNSERCKVQIFKIIHDGPVLVCEVNPFYPEILLTIGGTILAIWNTSLSEVLRRSPLLWRKARCRYISGMWSYIHPLAFVMIRADAYYEYWNLSTLSNNPIMSFKHNGTMVVKLYSDSRKNHVRKKTFVTTDEIGALKVFTLPSWEQNGMEDSDEMETQDYLKRTLELKKYVEDLRRKCAEKLKQPVEIIDESVELSYPSSEYEVPKPVVKRKKNYYADKVKQWQMKEEMRMRDELLANKHIRIEDIKVIRKPLEQEVKKKEKLRKVQLVQNNSTGQILRTISSTSNKVRRNIKVDCPPEIRADMKKQYRDNYEEVEKYITNEIKERPYTIMFDWNAFICRKVTKVYSKTILTAKYTGGVALYE